MDARLARLRWRCRRGMRELDTVLQRFLETDVARLTDAEIGCFEQILELPDPALRAYLLGGSAPDDASTAALIERIRSSAHV